MMALPAPPGRDHNNIELLCVSKVRLCHARVDPIARSHFNRNQVRAEALQESEVIPLRGRDKDVVVELRVSEEIRIAVTRPRRLEDERVVIQERRDIQFREYKAQHLTEHHHQNPTFTIRSGLLEDNQPASKEPGDILVLETSRRCMRDNQIPDNVWLD